MARKSSVIPGWDLVDCAMKLRMARIRSLEADCVDSLATKVSLIAGASSPRLAYTDIGTSCNQTERNRESQGGEDEGFSLQHTSLSTIICEPVIQAHAVWWTTGGDQ